MRRCKKVISISSKNCKRWLRWKELDKSLNGLFCRVLPLRRRLRSYFFLWELLFISKGLRLLLIHRKSFRLLFLGLSYCFDYCHVCDSMWLVSHFISFLGKQIRMRWMFPSYILTFLWATIIGQLSIWWILFPGFLTRFIDRCNRRIWQDEEEKIYRNATRIGCFLPHLQYFLLT